MRTTTRGRYVPHGLPDDSPRVLRFGQWVERQRARGRTAFHIVKMKRGHSYFAMTPQEYARFPAEGIISIPVSTHEVA